MRAEISVVDLQHTAENGNRRFAGAGLFGDAAEQRHGLNVRAVVSQNLPAFPRRTLEIVPVEEVPGRDQGFPEVCFRLVGARQSDRLCVKKAAINAAARPTTSSNIASVSTPVFVL